MNYLVAEPIVIGCEVSMKIKAADYADMKIRVICETRLPVGKSVAKK